VERRWQAKTNTPMCKLCLYYLNNFPTCFLYLLFLCQSVGSGLNILTKEDFLCGSLGNDFKYDLVGLDVVFLLSSQHLGVRKVSTLNLTHFGK
jgi:hypothetical protein